LFFLKLALFSSAVDSPAVFSVVPTTAELTIFLYPLSKESFKTYIP
jgi:hypothetical protein